MKRIFAAVVVTALMIAWTGCGENPFSPDGWKVKKKDGFTLHWRVVGSDLEAKLEGPSTGWVAVGFAGSYLMHDANIIIGAVTGSSVNIRDDFGINDKTHVSDTSLQGGKQNVSNKSGEEGSGTTTIHFTIPLNSGDLYDNVLSQGKTYNVVFICGDDGDDDPDSDYKQISATSITI